MSVVSETLAIVQTIHKLYRTGFVVARNAPNDVRDAVNDLDALGRALFELKKKIERHGDESFQQSYHGTLANCLQRCSQAVNEFEALLKQFRALNTSSAMQIVPRLKWAVVQDDVAGFHQRISRLLEILNLALAVYNTTNGEGASIVPKTPDVHSSSPLSSPSRNSDDGSVFSQSTTKARQLVETEADISAFVRGARADSVIIEDELQLNQQRKTCHQYLDPNAQTLLRKGIAKMEGELTPERWLSLSSWWLLKARTIRNWIRDAEQRQQRPSTRCDLDAHCYTNLLKSSWILEKAVIARGGPWSRRARRFIRDLCSALDIDLAKYIDSITHPEGTVPLDDRATALTERRLIDDSCKNDVISPDRFLAVNLQDCGLPLRETVLYRTFVDAQFRHPEEVGHMSDSTPYLLLLWAQKGDSELFASICDQHDTLNLCSQVSFDDGDELESQYDNEESILSLSFSNITAGIRFSTPEDGEKFLSIPRKFFVAMETRAAQSDEMTIFDTVVSKASFMPPPNSAVRRDSDADSNDTRFRTNNTPMDVTRRVKGTSCSLRIFESTPKGRWKTTRRLVLGSWAGDKEPWCYSFWLPLSRVQVRYDGALQVTLQWADFRKLQQSAANRVLGYVYDPDDPKNCVDLTFSSEHEAMKFAECILQLTECKGYIEGKQALVISPQNSDSIRVYDMYDEEDEMATYQAIVHCKTMPNEFRVSYIYFLYNALDFKIDQAPHGTRLTINSLLIPHYVAKQRQPEFGGLDRSARGNLSTYISDDLVVELLQKLTGWRLLIHLTIPEWRRKAPILPRRHRHVAVHVWERGGGPDTPFETQKRLTARLLDGESSSYFNWYCAEVPRDVERKMTDYCVSLRLNIQNGDYLTIDNMVAHHSKTGFSSSGAPSVTVAAVPMSWKLVLTFDSTEDQSNFWKALGFDHSYNQGRSKSFTSDSGVPLMNRGSDTAGLGRRQMSWVKS